MQLPPSTSGAELVNWNWKVARQFVSERFGVSLSRCSCLNCRHRLELAFKWPEKSLLKADGSNRQTFVSEYAILKEEV